VLGRVGIAALTLVLASPTTRSRSCCRRTFFLEQVLPLELLIDKPWMTAAPPGQACAALAAMAILGKSAAYISN
jgi:hypothetical protein